jgi:polyhydroxyalkanoate synthesis regulator phasin
MKYTDVLKRMRDIIEDVIEELSEELNMSLEDAKAGVLEIKNNIDSILDESGSLDDNVVLDQIKELHEAIEDMADELEVELNEHDSKTPLFQSLHNDASAMRHELDDSHLLKPKPYGQI